MKKIAHKAAALIDVKTIVTFALVGVTCVLALRGQVSEEFFASVVTAVITYFFTRRKE